MKSNFYNSEKAKEEAKAKEIIRDEQYKRSIYFQTLVKDKKFQKYVIEEILDAEIKANQTISDNLESIIKTTPEELQRVLLAKAGALAEAKNIKNKILASI